MRSPVPYHHDREDSMRGTMLRPTILIAVALAGCAADDPPFARDGLAQLIPDTSHRTAEIDLSAGPQETWVLDHLLTVGTSEESQRASTARFERIADVQLFADGRIGVVDAGALQVSVYDDRGVLSAVLGRSGDGPGEFSLLSRVRQCGQGEFNIVDDAKMLMKVFGADGSFRTEHRLFGYNPNQPPWTWDCAGSQVLTMQWGDGDPRVGDIGRFRMQVPLALSGPDGRVSTVLGSILGPERYRFQNRGTGPAPLGAVTGLAMDEEAVYVAEGPLLRIDAFSFDGRHLWTIQATPERRRVDQEAYIESQKPTRMGANEERAFNARWRDWDFPEYLPEFRGLLVDDDGLLWVERFPEPEDSTTMWRVFGSDGSWRASVEVPENVELKDVTLGKAAGVLVDELGVQSAIVLEIRREGGL